MEALRASFAYFNLPLPPKRCASPHLARLAHTARQAVAQTRDHGWVAHVAVLLPTLCEATLALHSVDGRAAALAVFAARSVADVRANYNQVRRNYHPDKARAALEAQVETLLAGVDHPPDAERVWTQVEVVANGNFQSVTALYEALMQGHYREPPRRPEGSQGDFASRAAGSFADRFTNFGGKRGAAEAEAEEAEEAEEADGDDSDDDGRAPEPKRANRGVVVLTLAQALRGTTVPRDGGLLIVPPGTRPGPRVQVRVEGQPRPRWVAVELAAAAAAAETGPGTVGFDPASRNLTVLVEVDLEAFLAGARSHRVTLPDRSTVVATPDATFQPQTVELAHLPDWFIEVRYHACFPADPGDLALRALSGAWQRCRSIRDKPALRRWLDLLKPWA